MRKCKYTNTYAKTVQFGLFHQWGNDYEEFDAGPGNITTAIIELADGTIITPPASCIQFLSDDYVMPTFENEKE